MSDIIDDLILDINLHNAQNQPFLYGVPNYFLRQVYRQNKMSQDLVRYGLGAGIGYGMNRLANWYNQPVMQPTPPRRRRRGKKQTLTSKIKSVVNNQAATKYCNIATSTASPVAGTSVVVPISLVSVGDTDVTREGMTINVRSVQLRGSITIDVDETSDTFCRMLLFRAHQNIEGVLPTVTEILMSDDLNSLRQIDNKGDYKVYMDKRFLVKVTDTNVTHRILLDYYKKFDKTMKTYFDGDGELIADAEKGHWFMILMTASTTGNTPSWAINSRITFKDM